MRPSIARHKWSIRIFGLALFFCVWTLQVFANSGAVVIRDDVAASDREVLVQKLRKISGWQDLKFDRSGLLQTGTREPIKGSASARELLAKAVAGQKVIVLEDASSRADVAFCKVFEARPLRANSSIAPVFVVLVDFEDFGKVMGDKEARASFDVGWAVLHELDHVVTGSFDPAEHLAVGQCEESINQMRLEVGLPVRMDYFFSSLPYAPDSHLVSRLVRIRFKETQTQNKVKSYWIIWDAAVVGGLPDTRLASTF